MKKIEEPADLDNFDLAIVAEMQKDAMQPQRLLAERIGLSQNACWRRLQKLQERGVLEGASARVNARALGLDLTVFVMVKTRHHSEEWSQKFRRRVESIPEVVAFHRIGGSWDYLLQVVTANMAGYDAIYQALISGFDHETVTGFFSMETMFDRRPLAPPRFR